jgi:hypothetical protein
MDGQVPASETEPMQKRFATLAVQFEEPGADEARRAHAPEQRRRSEFGSKAGGVDQSVHDALTDLSAYTLSLDLERHRLDDRILELAEVESSVAERRALLRERDGVTAELTALRRTIAACSDQL